MSERSPYTLDADQLQKAVQALEKAAQTLRPKPSEERLYRLLGICVRFAVGALAGMALAGVTYMMLGVVLPKNGEADTPIETDFAILTGVFVFLFLLAAIGALIFLLLNQSVIRRAFRQRRLLKKLGIGEFSLSAWRLQRRGHRWSRLAGAVLTGGGILALAVGLLELVSGIGMSIYMKLEHIGSVAITVVIMYGLLFAFGVTILIWRFVQRSREQWAIVADANRLRSSRCRPRQVLVRPSRFLPLWSRLRRGSSACRSRASSAMPSWRAPEPLIMDTVCLWHATSPRRRRCSIHNNALLWKV
jgi:hypothetical protein